MIDRENLEGENECAENGKNLAPTELESKICSGGSGGANQKEGNDCEEAANPDIKTWFLSQKHLQNGNGKDVESRQESRDAWRCMAESDLLQCGGEKQATSANESPEIGCPFFCRRRGCDLFYPVSNQQDKAQEYGTKKASRKGKSKRTEAIHAPFLRDES